MRLAGFLILCCVAVQTALADDTNLTLTVGSIIYSNVTFGTVTPYSVSLHHSTGIASIPLEALPPELQQRFGYDPQKAAQYRVAKQKAQQKAQQDYAKRTRETQEREAAQQAQQAALQKAQKERGEPKTWVGEVTQVLPDGIIVSGSSEMGIVIHGRAGDPFQAPTPNRYIPPKKINIFVTNHPKQKQLAEGNSVSFAAYKDGTSAFLDADGVSRTVEKWVWSGEPK